MRPPIQGYGHWGNGPMQQDTKEAASGGGGGQQAGSNLKTARHGEGPGDGRRARCSNQTLLNSPWDPL